MYLFLKPGFNHILQKLLAIQAIIPKTESAAFGCIRRVGDNIALWAGDVNALENGFSRGVLGLVLAVLCFNWCSVDSAVAQVYRMKLPNPDEGFPTGTSGRSVALEGDTMVIGASLTAPFGLDNAGVVRIYKFDGNSSWTLQAELAASDAEASDNFGFSVAISGDTIAIGSHGDDDAGFAAGSVYIFTRTGDVWTEQQKLIASDGEAGDQLGYSVGISGNTVVAGAYADDTAGNETGAAYVFTRSAGVWTQQRKLTASDAAGGDRFGWTVGISGDTVIAGAPRDDDVGSASGAAYVFTRSGGVWSEQQKLTASDAAGGDVFGWSVAVDGETAAVGAVIDDTGVTDSGSAYVFTRSAGVWSEQQKLTASDPATGDAFGWSIAASGDTAIVGAHEDDDGGTGSGSAYVYTRSGAVWTEQQKLTASDGNAVDSFGESAAVSGDTVVVGAHSEQSGGLVSPVRGAGYVFTRSGSFWSEQEKLVKLPVISFAEDDQFGQSTAISGDTAVIGAWFDESRQGAVQVFTQVGGIWTHQQKLMASDPAEQDLFGVSSAISGDTVVVGAYYDDDVGVNSGSAYVITRSAGVWTNYQKLVAGDGAAGDEFGFSVAISGDTAVVGARNDDQGGNGSGSTYVYMRNAGVWSLQQKLTASDASSGDEFGYSVAIDGDTVAIGAPNADSSAVQSGAVYVFTRSAGVWSQQQKLASGDAALFDEFGSAVAIDGDTVVIGAYGTDDGGGQSGSAYIFVRSAGVWSESQELTADDAAANDRFGSSVAIEGDIVAVGAPYDGHSGVLSAGSAYVFERDGSIWSQGPKLISGDPAQSAEFGGSIAIGSKRVVCGAPFEYDPEINSGTAYSFNFNPELSVTPTALDFGSQAVDAGSIGPLSLVIENIGGEDLVTTLSLTGLVPGNYAVTSGTLNFILSSGTSTTIEIEFDPSVAGIRPAALNVDSNAVTTPSINVSLSGFGTVPEIDVTADGKPLFSGIDTLDLGTAEEGAISLSKTVIVANTGTMDSVLSLGDLVVDLPFVISEDLLSGLAVGTTDSFTIELPTDGIGDFSSTVSLTSNDPDENPYILTVIGEVVAVPEIVVTVDSQPVFSGSGVVDLGVAPQGAANLITTITVGNIGTTSSLLTLGGPFVGAPFFTSGSLASSLGAGTTDSLTVELATDAVGSFSNTLSLINNDSNENPYLLTVMGEIIAVPEIEATSGSQPVVHRVSTLDLGTTQQGETTLSLTVTIANAGTSDSQLNLGGLGVDAPFLIAEGLPTSLAAGTTDSFTVEMPTLSLGNFSSTVSLINNDPDENPFTFAVTAEIVAEPEIEVTSGSQTVTSGVSILDLGATQQGATTLSLTVAVSNTGTSDSILSLGPLAVGNPFAFAEELAGSLGAGTSDTLTIILPTTIAGDFSSTVSLSNNDADENPFVFYVSGQIVPIPEIDVTVGGQPVISGNTILNLGTTQQGGSPLMLDVQVQNTGTSDSLLSLGGLSVDAPFIIADGLPDLLEAGATDSLTIELPATAAGDFSSTVSLTSNDGDENPFSFSVMGEIVPRSESRAQYWQRFE